jgi:hypothetical protein
MPAKLKPNDPTVLDAVRLYQEGKSTFQAGKILGMCDGAIRKRLICAGVSRRPVGGPKLSGFISSTKLMEILGCAHSTVKNILKRSGVDIKQCGRRVWIKEDDLDYVKKEHEKDFCLSIIEWTTCGLLERDLAWLGGIMDGEGSIQISFSKKTEFCGSSVNIVNSGKAIIEKSRKVLDKLGIFYTVTRTIPKKSRHRGTRVLFRISAKRYQDQWRWLRIIKPFLVQKKRDADIVMEFCEIRSKNQRRQKGVIRREAKRLRKELEICREDSGRGLEDLN